MSSSVSIPILVILFLTSLTTSTSNAASKSGGCNLYSGEWVRDESYPLFDPSKCTSIRKEFSCLKNGRPDHDYLKYRWQPKGCNLIKFHGVDLLKRIKGKKLLFVGDSVSENQWQSLVCLLTAAAGSGHSHIAAANQESNPTTTVTFQEYNASVTVFLSHYLVDIENQKVGRVLNLDSIKDGNTWKQYDVIIFNTWLWWYRTGPKQPFDYIENDGKVVKDMDRMEAFRKGLTTWAKWVNTESNPKSLIFFQGISPMHYKGEEWGKPGVTNCANETVPIAGSTYSGGEPMASKVLKEVLNTKISKPNRVHLLDITTLSQLRKDGHPGKYGEFTMDCTHWCTAGVIDTWNQLLYAQLVHG